MKQNLDILDFTLSANDMARIKTLDTDKPFLLGSHEDPEIVKWFMQYKNATNINNHISIAAIDYIKLFVYAFIVIRHVLSKCFACLLFEEAHEMARIREIEIIRHFTDSAVGE